MMRPDHHDPNALDNMKPWKRYNTRLAQLIPRHIYSPCVVNWDVLNRMGCDGEIDDMLRIRLREAGSNEEIFTSVAWIRAFNINEPIYAELCHEFYSTYEFDEVYADDELQTKKIQFHLDYWLSIRQEEILSFTRVPLSTIKNPILRVIHKMITYGICQRTTRYDKVQKNDLWLLSMFDARHQNGYVNVAWLISRWMKKKGAGTQKESQICCGQFISKIAKKYRVLIEDCKRVLNLYYRMGRMEIRQEAIERMEYRQSYHWDSYSMTNIISSTHHITTKVVMLGFKDFKIIVRVNTAQSSARKLHFLIYSCEYVVVISDFGIELVPLSLTCM
ncbi:hypothetical protein Tco_0196527 [Tanacetum coccineum]